MPTGDAVRMAGNAVDMSSRIAISTTVVASPAAAAETIIGQVSLPANFASTDPVEVSGWAALTVGTSGTAVRLRIRETNVSGTVIADTGALTGGISAGNLIAQDVEGLDAAAVGTYVLTAQVTAGAAASTVSAVKLKAATI